MADGVAITAGSGTTIATDDTGASGHVQLNKLAISTDGSATPIPADTANGLDVDVTRVTGVVHVDDNSSTLSIDDGGGSITVDGTVTATVASSGSDSTPNVHRNIKGVTATLTSQTDQATNATLLSSNSNRLGVTIVNDSTSILYIKFGATASIAAGGYNYKLQPDDTLEMPSGGLPLYTGRIDAIWSADASGWANVTEYT